MIIIESQLRKVINEELQIVLFEQRVELFEYAVEEGLRPLLLEASLVDIGREKFAQLSAKARGQWATQVAGLAKKATAFITKTLNQAIGLARTIMSKLEGSYDQAGRAGYLGAINGIRKMVSGAIRLSKLIGPFAVVAGCVLVFTLATAGTAHAAAAGVSPDPQLWSAAAEIIQQSLEALGGVEAIDPDIISRFTDVTSVDGEVVQSVRSLDVNRAMSVANQQVDALSTLTDAMREKVTRQGETLNLEQLMQQVDPKIQGIIEKALAEAQNLRQTNPELYEEYVRAGKTLDIMWNGTVEASTEMVRTTTSGPEASRTLRQTISTVGVGRDVPFRR